MQPNEPDPTEAVKRRIWARLRLYAAALEIAHSSPDCVAVEQTGMVAVPVQLIRNLQLAVADYPTEWRG